MSFDFFRKYQRTILWSAGIFALLTFASTGALYSMIDRIGAEPYQGATMVVGGDTITVTQEDERVGQQLAQAQSAPLMADRVLGGQLSGSLGVRGILAVTLPMSDRVIPTESRVPNDRQATDQPVQRFAALRRIAIHQGLGLSLDEADKAIARALEVEGDLLDRLGVPLPVEDSRGYANAYNMRYEELRLLVAEAVRIGTWTRLALLGVDRGDAAIAEMLGRYDRDDELTFKVAVLDETKLIEDLFEGEVPSEELLLDWLKGEESALEEGEVAPNIQEKRSRGLLDGAIAQATFFGLLYDGFVEAEWTEELADLGEITEAQRETIYNQWKDDRFKLEPPEDPNKKDDGGDDGAAKDDAEKDDAAKDGAAKEDGAEDDASAEGAADDQAELAHRPIEECAEELDRLIKTAHVVKKLVEQVRTARNEAAATLDDELKTLRESLSGLQERVTSTQLAYTNSGASDEERDPMLKAAFEGAQEALKTAQDAITEKNDARNEALRDFDSVGFFRGLVEGKSGAHYHKMEEAVPQEELRDIEDAFGRWPNPSPLVMGAANEGDLSNSSYAGEKGAFGFEAIFVDKLPIRDFDKRVVADFFNRQAMEQDEEDRAFVGDVVREWYLDKKCELRSEKLAEQMDEVIERMVKELKPEESAELDAKVDAEVAEKLTEWRTGVEAEIAKAEQVLGGLTDRSTRGYRMWNEKLAELKAELTTAPAKEAGYRSAAEADRDEAMDELIQAELKNVLEAAAKEVGYEMQNVGPFRRHIRMESRFEDKYPDAAVALWRLVVKSQPEEDEVGKGFLQLRDSRAKARMVGYNWSVQEPDKPKLTRRVLMQFREGDSGTIDTEVGGGVYSERMFHLAATQGFTMEALRKRYQWSLADSRSVDSQESSNVNQPADTPPADK